MSSTIKVILFLAVVVLCAWLAMVFLTNKHSRLQNSDATQSTAASNAYQVLRDQALHVKHENIGIAVPSRPAEPRAVLMDWVVGSDTATVVANSDGTASVCLSGGGGRIGGGQSHETIRKAAQKMVSIAAGCRQPQMRFAETYPLPPRGRVTFYALTDAGAFTAGASDEELRSPLHPLSKLGDAAQDIITQYSLFEKSN